METEIPIYYFDYMINFAIDIVVCYCGVFSKIFSSISCIFIVGKLGKYCICFYVKYYVIKQVIYLRNSCITIYISWILPTIHNMYSICIFLWSVLLFRKSIYFCLQSKKQRKQKIVLKIMRIFVDVFVRFD